MRKSRVPSLHQEDLLVEGMAMRSSILAWRSPMHEEAGGLQSMGHIEWDTTEQLTAALESTSHLLTPICPGSWEPLPCSKIYWRKSQRLSPHLQKWILLWALWLLEENISLGLSNSEWVTSERRFCVESLGCKPSLERLTEVVRSIDDNFFLSHSSKSALQFRSVQFSHSVVSDYVWPHGQQHARPPCPSPTPRVYPNSCPLSRWRHPTISYCRPLLLPSIFPSIRVFSNKSALTIRWPLLAVQLHHQAFQSTFRTDLL